MVLELTGAVLARSWRGPGEVWGSPGKSWGEELEQANVQDPSRLSVETSCRELEELGLGEELEQANVQDPSRLSVE